MNKHNSQTLRIVIGATLSIIFASIAWTNETIDYLAKLGYQNVNPNTLFLITTFLMTFSLSWLIWELLEKYG